MDDALAEQIRVFLAAAIDRGYGGGVAEARPDGMISIHFEIDALAYDDTWAGGDPFGGRTIVSIGGRPKWMCVYYGAVIDENEDPRAVYGFLRRALLAARHDFPVRGPEALVEDDLDYRRTHSGDLARFIGQEVISRAGRPIYRATFAGGLVDRRAG